MILLSKYYIKVSSFINIIYKMDEVQLGEHIFHVQSI